MKPAHSRPAFAEDFERGPAIDGLVEAFARGDYARVRVDAPRLMASAESQGVRDAAGELLERTQPDALAVALLALTGALLVLLAVYWVAHGKPPPGAVRSPSPEAVERLRGVD